MSLFSFFFFNDTATTEIYTLSLHDALPISEMPFDLAAYQVDEKRISLLVGSLIGARLEERFVSRSEEHTSELQSHLNLVCRLLLEKKKTYQSTYDYSSRSHNNRHPPRCVHD